MIENRINYPGESAGVVRTRLAAHMSPPAHSTAASATTRAILAEMRAETVAAAQPKPEVSPAVARAQRVRWGVSL